MKIAENANVITQNKTSRTQLQHYHCCRVGHTTLLAQPIFREDDKAGEGVEAGAGTN
jgi:hypothetical protein